MTNVKITITKHIERAMTIPDNSTIDDLRERLNAVGFDLDNCIAVRSTKDGSEASDTDIVQHNDNILFIGSDVYDAITEDEKNKKKCITTALLDKLSKLLDEIESELN